MFSGRGRQSRPARSRNERIRRSRHSVRIAHQERSIRPERKENRSHFRVSFFPFFSLFRRIDR